MSGSSPGWSLNYDPPPSEWNFWWAKKQDYDPILAAVVAAGGAPTPTGPNTLGGPLTLTWSGAGNALTVSTNTASFASVSVSGASAFNTITATGAGSFNTITASGLITPSSTVGIKGTATNDSVQAGSIGEFISSTITSGATVSLTTATSTNVTSISLTAGDWDVFGTAAFSPAGSTTVTQLQAGVSTTSGTLPTPPNGGYVSLNTTWATGVGELFTVGTSRALLTTTTSYFLVVNGTFAVSTMGAYGFIGARRRR